METIIGPMVILKTENTKMGDYKRIYKRIDRPKIKLKPNQVVAKYCKVKDYKLSNLKRNEKFRAGVIPYTICDGMVYFAFGVDALTGDLTDFGGGVMKTDGGEINGGIREFREESLGTFEPICNNDLIDHYIIHTNKMIILLVYYNVNPLYIRNKFRKKLLNTDTPEVTDIVWMTKDEILDSIRGKGRVIYSRVRSLLTDSQNLWSRF